MDSIFYTPDNPKKRNSLTPDWEVLFGNQAKRMFRRDSKDPAKYVEKRPKVDFLTGSNYVGYWNKVGMTKEGSYTFPYEVRYSGEFYDNQFNGYGVYKYPMGQQVGGYFGGEKYVIFGDGLEFKGAWTYLDGNDRRYLSTIKDGFHPAPDERVTNDDAPRKIPDGCYDVGDGFYNPTLKSVVSYTNTDLVLRIPTAKEEEWIIKNCRKAWDEPVGYRPDLYPWWTTGADIKELDFNTVDVTTSSWLHMDDSSSLSNYSVNSMNLSEPHSDVPKND